MTKTMTLPMLLLTLFAAPLLAQNSAEPDGPRCRPVVGGFGLKVEAELTHSSDNEDDPSVAPKVVAFDGKAFASANHRVVRMRFEPADSQNGELTLLIHPDHPMRRRGYCRRNFAGIGWAVVRDAEGNVYRRPIRIVGTIRRTEEGPVMAGTFHTKRNSDRKAVLQGKFYGVKLEPDGPGVEGELE